MRTEHEIHRFIAGICNFVRNRQSVFFKFVRYGKRKFKRIDGKRLLGFRKRKLYAVFFFFDDRKNGVFGKAVKIGFILFAAVLVVSAVHATAEREKNMVAVIPVIGTGKSKDFHIGRIRDFGYAAAFFVDIDR